MDRQIDYVRVPQSARLEGTAVVAQPFGKIGELRLPCISRPMATLLAGCLKVRGASLHWDYADEANPLVAAFSAGTEWHIAVRATMDGHVDVGCLVRGAYGDPFPLDDWAHPLMPCYTSKWMPAPFSTLAQAQQACDIFMCYAAHRGMKQLDAWVMQPHIDNGLVHAGNTED